MKNNIKLWDTVKIESYDDGKFDYNRCNEELHGQEAIVVQILKSGLYMVALHNGQKHRFSKRHLTLVKSYDPKNETFPRFTLDKVS